MRISSVVSWYRRRVLDEIVGEEGTGKSERLNELDKEASDGRRG
jgi:hypothetical protein